MALAKQLKVFRRELPKLLEVPENIGKFALVQHGVEGIWPTMDEALAAGYERFGVEPFLVKQVVANERAVFFSRRVTPCR